MSTDGVHFSSIAGATRASYTFTASQAQSGEQFQAVFSNAAGSDFRIAATGTSGVSMANSSLVKTSRAVAAAICGGNRKLVPSQTSEGMTIPSGPSRWAGRRRR